MISFAIVRVGDETYIRESNGRWAIFPEGSFFWQETKVSTSQRGFAPEQVEQPKAAELEATLVRKVMEGSRII